ncbi:DMT family transporter [Adlercreutzia shanghongiae]|uniref:DMT family transporter n=1 Tax=Adlercreutzia shanghongiae TaxID=3111773 RepID=A0ABU6IW10_9ACTN|nr:DMT family transporter [Adlercreutzia sp. R22]MEC4293908.1 DMT family transporter [Adlercreutzia sp. R22]
MLPFIRQHGIPLWVYKASLLLAAAIWGMGTVVIKSTVDEFPPSWLVGVRFTGAGIILGIVCLGKLRDRLSAEGPQHLRDGAILGALLFLSYWTNSTGLTDTTASNSAFLTTLYVVIIPFLGWFIIRKKPTRFNIAAALACVGGVACVAYTGAGAFSLRFGDVVTLFSALFLSLHVLYTAKFAPGRSMTVLTVIQFIVAGLLGFAVGAITEPTPNFANLSPDTWISLVYLTVLASCVALGLQNAAVARVDPAQAALFLSTECVFGVIFSILLLGEVLTPPLFAGFALIFAGIVISEYLPLRAEKKRAQRAAEEKAPASCEASAPIRDLEEADAFMR